MHSVQRGKVQRRAVDRMTLERPHRLVGRNFLVLGGAEAVARVIAFGSTIFVARVVGVEGYGAVAFAAAVVLYLTQIVEFGVEVIGIREIAVNRLRTMDITPSLITARLILATGIVVAVVGISMTIVPPPEGPVLAVYALSLLPIAAGTRWIYVGLETTRLPGIARLARDTMLLVLVLALVRGPGDVVAVPLAIFVAECVGALILAAWLVRRGLRLPLQLRLSPVASVARQAWPIVGHGLLGLLIYNSDLLFLRFFRDLASVGLYAAGYTLISFLLNLGVVYCNNLIATSARLGTRSPAALDLYRRANQHVFAASLPLAVGGVLFAQQMIRVVFGPSYAPAGIALAILIGSVPFSLLRNVMQATLIACGRQDRVFRLTALSAVLNLVLNALFVPRYGIAGAATATLLTEIGRFWLALRDANREGYTMDWSLLLPPVLAGAVMAAILIGLGITNLWGAIALGGIIYVGLMSALVRRSEGS